MSNPFCHRKVSALKTLMSRDLTGLYTALGEENATIEDMMTMGQAIFAALYGVAETTYMNIAQYDIYPRKSLPPTDNNLLYHVLSTHLQMMLWKGVDQQSPIDVDITNCRSKIVAGVLSPCTTTRPLDPTKLINVIGF